MHALTHWALQGVECACAVLDRWPFAASRKLIRQGGSVVYVELEPDGVAVDCAIAFREELAEAVDQMLRLLTPALDLRLAAVYPPGTPLPVRPRMCDEDLPPDVFPHYHAMTLSALRELLRATDVHDPGDDRSARIDYRFDDDYCDDLYALLDRLRAELRREAGLARLHEPVLPTEASDQEGTGFPSKPTDRPRARPHDWLASAMLLVNDHPDWSNARIAEEVGKSRSTLSRSKYYREAARLARAPVRTPRRGFHIRHPDGRIGLDAVSDGVVA